MNLMMAANKFESDISHLAASRKHQPETEQYQPQRCSFGPKRAADCRRRGVFQHSAIVCAWACMRERGREGAVQARCQTRTRRLPQISAKNNRTTAETITS